MNRRTFLAASLAAPGGRLRIGFLGVAHSHAREKVRVVRESPQWELAGIAESDPKLRAAYEADGVRILTRVELLGDASVPVVAVESAVREHASAGRAALAAGKHLHLEKPPSLTLPEMWELVALAQKRRLVMQMGYMWRYHPGINAALEAARRGWLGEVYLVRGTMNTLIDAAARREWARFSGGQMFEQGGHLIDPMVRLLGRPTRISPFLKHHGDFQDDLRDNTLAVFEFPKALGVILSSVLQPNAAAHRTFEILGSNGTAVVRPIEPPALVVDLLKAAGPYRAGSQTVPLAPFRRYAGDFDDLARAVSTRGALAVSPQEDLLVQECLLRASQME